MEQRTPDTLGKRLRELRELRELTQAQAAKSLGMAQPSLSEIETDKNVEMNGTTLEKFCRLYGVTMRYVLFGDAEELPDQIAGEIRRRAVPQDVQESYLNFLRQTFPYKAFKPETPSEKMAGSETKPAASHSLTVVDSQPTNSLAGPQVMARRVPKGKRQNGDKSQGISRPRTRRRS